MANKYSSSTRRYLSHANYEATITPPNDFTVTVDSGTDYQFNMYTSTALFNADSVVAIRNIGLFSNFADGLVFKTPGAIMTLGIKISVATAETALSGNFAITAGSKAMTTTASQSFSPNDVIKITTEMYTIASGSGTSWTLKEYALNTYSNVSAHLLTLDTGTNVLVNIDALNTMFPVNTVIDPVEYVTGTALYTLIQGNLSNSTSVVFLTKSINTSFATDTCFFDVVADLEYTEA